MRMPAYLRRERLGLFAEALAKDYRLYVPVAEEAPAAGEQEVARAPGLRPYSPGVEMILGRVRAVEPPKALLVPPRERVAAYGPGADVGKEPAAEPVAILGLAACDLRSLRVLDAVFLEGEDRDPFYEARRSRMLVISADCTEPLSSCFCTLLEESPHPREGFDINLSPVGEGFVVEAGSEKGRQVLEAREGLLEDVPPGVLGERDARRERVAQSLSARASAYKGSLPRAEVLKRTEWADAWLAAARDCVECAACLFACPTCHCFLLHDHKAPEGFVRLRSWDACAYAGFARVAGGANPRERIADRFQHRYRHKFEYFLERYGFEACTGCGRCIQACPGGIDMREVLKRVEEVV